MAGLEVALAVLGVTSQLFCSAVDSYRLISTAQGLKRDASVNYWKLRIQEIRLESWGRHWGANTKGFEAYLEEENLVDDVRGILTQIQELLRDSTKLKEKYGMNVEDIVEQDTDDPIAVSRPKTIKHDDKRKWKQKFSWSIRDKDKFEDLVTNLKELNDGLYCLLDASGRKSLSNCIESDILRMTNDAMECRDIQQACISIRETVTKHDSKLQKWFDSAYADLVLAAAAKKLAIEQSNYIVPPLGTSVPNAVTRYYERDQSSVQGYLKSTPTHLRILAEHRDQPVLLEWKAIDTTNPYQPLIAQRMEHLATLLSPDSPKPNDFRVLNCHGYFRDKTQPRYGYLLQLPPQAIAQPPITLHDLLARGGPHEQLVNLGDRFNLARQISSSILRLHECGWVHTALRSECILFFFTPDPNSPQTPKPQIAHPYLTNFSYSKPTDPTESTLEYSQPTFTAHDLYRHPEIISARLSHSPLSYSYDRSEKLRQQQRHDLFSLGIVLLEIGLWEQIKAVWKDKYTPSQFLQKLLSAYVPRLGHKMGATYRDVVKDLLSMKFDRKETVQKSVSDKLFFSTADEDETTKINGEDDQAVKGESSDPELDWWSIVVRLEKCRA